MPEKSEYQLNRKNQVPIFLIIDCSDFPKLTKTPPIRRSKKSKRFYHLLVTVVVVTTTTMTAAAVAAASTTMTAAAERPFGSVFEGSGFFDY